MTLEKREKPQKIEFPYPRNIYWGDLKEIEGCGLWNFREKQLVPKCLFPMANAIFMQHVIPEQSNYNIQQVDESTCIVNECLTIEICVGDHMKMQDGAAVGILVKQQPTDAVKPYLPNWEADYKLFLEKTFIQDMKTEATQEERDPDEYDISNSGVVACKTTGGHPSASHLMLCQQTADKDLEIGVASILNCLDCAEIMKVGTLNLPTFQSLPDELAGA